MNDEDQYQVYAHPSPSLASDVKPGGKFAPKEGYAVSGMMPMGRWVAIVYKRAETVHALTQAVQQFDVKYKEMRTND